MSFTDTRRYVAQRSLSAGLLTKSCSRARNQYQYTDVLDPQNRKFCLYEVDLITATPWNLHFEVRDISEVEAKPSFTTTENIIPQ